MTKCETILENIGMTDILEKYNIYNKNGKCLCPFHNDKNPSATVDKNNKWFHCFACGANYNVIDFVSNYEKCTRRQAISIISGIFGLGLEFKLSEYDLAEIEKLKIEREIINKKKSKMKEFEIKTCNKIIEEIRIWEQVEKDAHLTRGEYKNNDWENANLFFFAKKRINELDWFYNTICGLPKEISSFDYIYPKEKLLLLREIYKGEITI